jgi:hypothetical protein
MIPSICKAQKASGSMPCHEHTETRLYGTANTFGYGTALDPAVKSTRLQPLSPLAFTPRAKSCAGNGRCCSPQRHQCGYGQPSFIIGPYDYNRVRTDPPDALNGKLSFIPPREKFRTCRGRCPGRGQCIGGRPAGENT